MGIFKQKVLEIVSNIPEGETRTYKEVASLAGNAKAARAVGMILSKNQDLNIPCHRVIRSDGSTGGYNNLRGISKDSLLFQESCNAMKQRRYFD